MTDPYEDEDSIEDRLDVESDPVRSDTPPFEKRIRSRPRHSRNHSRRDSFRRDSYRRLSCLCKHSFNRDSFGRSRSRHRDIRNNTSRRGYKRLYDERTDSFDSSRNMADHYEPVPCNEPPVRRTTKALFTVRFKPHQNRGCTDIFCLLFFIVFLAAWGFMIFFFSNRVDIQQTIYPSNSYGQICGRGANAKKPYLAFFNIFTCVASPELSIVEGCKTPLVCVEKCPSHTFSINDFDDDKVRARQAELAICLPKVKPTAQTIRQLVKDGQCAQYYFNSDPIGGRCVPSVIKLFGQDFILDELSDNPMQFKDQSKINKESLIQNNQIIGSLMGTLNIGIKAIKDIQNTWRWILIGLVAVVVVTILWIYVMQHFAYSMTWITIFLLLGLNSAGLYFSFEHYKSFDRPANHTVAALIRERTNLHAASNPQIEFRSMKMMALDEVPEIDEKALKYLSVSDQDLYLKLDLVGMLKDNLNDFLNKQSTWKWISIILAVILGIMLLMVCCLGSRIRLASAVIQESGKAVMQMKSTLFFPIIPFLLWLACCAGAAAAIVIISAGTHSNYRYPNGDLCSPVDLDDSHYAELNITRSIDNKTVSVWENSTEPDCKMEKTPFDRKTVYAAHAINLFGIIWVMFFLGDLCFTILSGAFSTWYWTFNKNDVPFFSLFSSFTTISFHHLGSIALGSFIISVVRFIRIVLEFIDKKCKKYADFAMVQWVMWIFKCCFWCLEVFIKFINKNAYIYMAMYGTGFLTSARKAFLTIANNPVRAFVLSWLSDFLLFISKIVVTSLVGVAGYFLLTNQFPQIATFDVQYYWAPLGAFLFLSYHLAGALFGVYEVAIDTIFFCYLKDSEDNDGSAEKPYFMSKSLAKVFGKKNESPVERLRAN